MGNNKVHPLESVAVSSVEMLNNTNKEVGDTNRYRLEITSHKEKITNPRVKSQTKDIWVARLIFAVEINNKRKIIFHTAIPLKDINHRFNTYGWRGELCRKFMTESIKGYAVFAGEYIKQNAAG